MFVSDTLTLISAELLKKNGWHAMAEARNEKNQCYQFVANYSGFVATLTNNIVVYGTEIIITDQWTFTLENIDLRRTKRDSDLLTKASAVRYMEEVAFLIDISGVSWVKFETK